MFKILKEAAPTVKEKTLCFTGRRPKDLRSLLPERTDPYSREAQPGYQQIVNNLCAILEEQYSKGYRKFISGGAQGMDQLAF